MDKKLVYVEESILTERNTLLIIKKMGSPTVIPITHYKDVFNQGSSNWRMQKEVQKIILAKRTDNFFYKGSQVTPSFGHQHFYYNTLALNCIYDCEYCYLQGLFGTPHLVLFVNNSDFINHTQSLIQSLNEPLYLALSYDTDLLALEHWYPYCKEWIEFAQHQPKITIEIRTKSNNINALKNISPTPNTILAWTVSPQEVIDWHEPKTPSLTARLKAIKTAINWGWQVRLCFDPLLAVPNWKQVYTNLFEAVNENIAWNSLHSVSLGVFRNESTT
jgi:spore photoproduct lyase